LINTSHDLYTPICRRVCEVGRKLETGGHPRRWPCGCAYYRGAEPALIDLLSGQVQVGFISAAASMEYIRAGRLRALAMTSTMRLEALSDIPTVNDFVPGYEASYWVGLPSGSVGLKQLNKWFAINNANKESGCDNLRGT